MQPRKHPVKDHVSQIATGFTGQRKMADDHGEVWIVDKAESFVKAAVVSEGAKEFVLN
eukprot:SAG11_NODE_16181_length_555_cov_0.701754_1_plen_57_part_10